MKMFPLFGRESNSVYQINCVRINKAAMTRNVSNCVVSERLYLLTSHQVICIHQRIKWKASCSNLKCYLNCYYRHIQARYLFYSKHFTLQRPGIKGIICCLLSCCKHFRDRTVVSSFIIYPLLMFYSEYNNKQKMYLHFSLR